MNKPSAIVIGAGIVGLATARALAIKGYQVTVFERNERSVGASIRNFGMIWPIGQPEGELYNRAVRTRAVWKEICLEAGIWHNEVGSLHLAYHDDELQVMAEYVTLNKANRNCDLLNPDEVLSKTDGVNTNGMKGALWSPAEMIVEARQAIAQVAQYLEQKHEVTFNWNTVVNNITHPAVYAGKQHWEADEIYVCSGADFETLYPEVFAEIEITKCKLQMMRFEAQPDGWRMGPSLCGGLSMIHYTGFQSAPSLKKLKERYQQQYAEYLKWGIHVMVSQNHNGELTIGDSHEYGLTHEPFNKDFINRMILDYLDTFTAFKNQHIIQNWNGVYPKMTNGQTEFVFSPESGVTIINALGGAGMTLSFGLAEEIIAGVYEIKTSPLAATK
ncbi:FAD dependent oxidoreductase TIGR03364 [Mucilaginibacter gracilis]|uniref:FAD dependent oxidoreductase TIGR03364 n=1 Tax=Mucilaginibacter gracilis TaxID=423350 RepID=A0A495J6G5_9SPHI|nr:TIGR03364 family FAD-dependent oxidoreductase [Mucilaginibacter gracilis]RKR84580.1 FAD dependent oxidoreductase TIGR03364 [Mucilaginibacter gracilis]